MNKGILILLIVGVLLAGSVIGERLIRDGDLMVADTGWTGAGLGHTNSLTVGGWTLRSGTGGTYDNTNPYGGNTLSIRIDGTSDPVWKYENTSAKAERVEIWVDTASSVDNFIAVGYLLVGASSAESATNYVCGCSNVLNQTQDTGVAFSVGSFGNLTFIYQPAYNGVRAYVGATDLGCMCGAGWGGADSINEGGLFNVTLESQSGNTMDIGNITMYNSSGGAPPAPIFPPIIVNITYPSNGTNFSITSTNFEINVTHNETTGVNCTLNTTDYTQSGAVNSVVSFLNNTLVPSGKQTILATCNKTGTSNGNGIGYFYTDIINPSITTSYVTGTTTYQGENITGTFTFTDDYALWSYNVSVDNVVFQTKSSITTATHVYNFSYNTSALFPGEHTTKIILADGHTAKESKHANDVKKGLFNNYLKYEYDEGYIKVSAGFFDRWDTEKKSDRYSFEFTPNNKLNKYEFEVESNSEVNIIDAPNTPWKKWIIVNNHWIDFDMGEEVNLDIIKVNKNKVKVTLEGNLDKKEKITFNSIGDLNIITKEYTFNVFNATHTYTNNSIEGQILTYTLNITKNSSTVSTNASLLFNGAYLTGVTKTPSDYSDKYTIDVVNPVSTTLITTNNFNWTFNATPLGGTTYNYKINATNNYYQFLLGQCNATLNETALRFDVKDANTLANITGFNFETNFNVWGTTNTSYIKSFGFNNVSVNHLKRICMYPWFPTLTTDYDALFSHSEYDDTHYIIGDGTINSSTEVIKIYMVNSSLATGITIKIIDQGGNVLPGYIIEAHKYNPATNDYTLITTQYSDSNGETKFYLDVTTYEYRFIVKDTNGVTVYTEPKQKLISTSYTFPVPIGETVDIIDFKLNNLNYVLTADKITKTFTLTWEEISYLASRINLTVYRGNSTEGLSLLSNQNSSLNTGSLSYVILENTTLKSVNYKAVVNIIAVDDGFQHTIDTVTINFKVAWEVFGTETLLMTFVFVGTMIFIGAAVSPILALVAAIFSMVILWWLGFYVVSATALISVIILLVVIIARLNR